MSADSTVLRAMRFRPCIDLHAGKVKQIVGSTLSATGENSTSLETNFETSKSSADFAALYKRDALPGGHVIMLGPNCQEAALAALREYPGGMHVGGGITATTAKQYIDAGASHVIVTSYVFQNGQIVWDRLKELVAAVGKERLVLDLSCRRRPRSSATAGAGESSSTSSTESCTNSSSNSNRCSSSSSSSSNSSEDPYYVVTDKWQTYTDFAVTKESLLQLAGYCDEFLVHGVEVEGRRCGILEDLVQCLGEWSPIPVTYAGGARTIEDMELVREIGKGRVDLTIGSALDVTLYRISAAVTVHDSTK